MKHIGENDLVLLYYGELSDHGEAIAHLEGCPECRAEYERLKDVLAAVDSVPAPDWSASHTDELWIGLRPQLATLRPATRVSFTPVRRWALAASIAACLLAAFMLGRFWPRPQVETASAPAGNVRERILLVAVGDHLERSQMMLVDLVNTQGNGTVDLSSEQARAQDLVAGNRLYRQTATREGDAAVADVLDRLERILLAIAHGPSQMPAKEFEELRKSIESQGIILKVRLIGAKARQVECPPARDTLRPSV
jgi:anti-sigma factor RsiW